MNFQQLFTPFVLASLFVAQGYPAAYAQQPAPQPAQQPAAQSAQQPAQPGLNNDSVIKMVKAGLSDDVIISTIGSSQGAFDISAEGVIALKSAGVSDKVISAIVNKTTAAAQPAPAPAPAPAPTPAPAPPQLLLAEGTEVPLTFDQDLSSKTAHDGDTVELILAQDLKVGDVVVARAGSKAVGEVTNAKKSGMMGKPGELNIRLNYLKTGNAKVHLRGTKGKEGDSGTTGVVVLTVLFGVVGFVHHGKQVEIKKGTALTVFVADDIRLEPAI
jgi:pyruvate/2-oxoglutarate dehydrogenase complex dihydrolipoamide acyltransferase (E2) component